MLYLVVAENVTEGAPQPPEALTRYIEEAVIPTWKQVVGWEKEGRVVAGGALAGRRGAALIVEAGSHGEVGEMVSSLPVWGQAELEIMPLVSLGEGLEQAERALERIKAAAG